MVDSWNDQAEDTHDVRPAWGVWSPPAHLRACGEVQIRHESSFGYLEKCSGNNESRCGEEFTK